MEKSYDYSIKHLREMKKEKEKKILPFTGIPWR